MATPEIPDVFDLRSELLPFLGLSLQLVITSMARLAIMVIDSAFLGHLGTNELAGASLATLWIELPLCTVWGMASAQIALCGQAYGAKNYLLMGIWLQMALILITILSLPTTVWYFFLESILRHTTDDATVVAFGARFAELLSPSIWPLLAYVCLRQYLQAMGVVLPTTINGIVCIGIDIGANYLLIYTAGLGFDGSPLATVIAAWFQPVALFIYAFVYKKHHHEAWGGWKLSELTWSRWKTFFRMALPLGLNDGCDLLAAAALSFVVAKMGANVIATQAILSSVWMMVGAVFYGIGLASEVGLAEHLGGGRPRAARARAMMGFAVLALAAVLVCIVLWVGRASVVGLFTKDSVLLAMYTDVLPLYIAASSLNGLGIGLLTALEGMGQMGFVTFVTVIGLWGVQLPLAYYFGIVQDLGLPGVWTATTIAAAVKVAIMGVRFLCIDWQKMVQEAVLGAEADGPKLSSTEADDPAVLEARDSESIYIMTSSPVHSKAQDVGHVTLL
ncbi:hypothetical protein SPRG_08930 [Saprolegnia parasitica CBS 223.65]|uniref:MATE efflux family protein n=1 Tax=Saprolegnia parasitica (strain CBS 223.65) TaxID=695850 RepID=A0A067CGG2_SAPPC|nr:hypothetical protein SPRG_08930 [Saprolegnia parasitica CBS 223.65]KDO25631.1 hypothetical protein SPRG_08930 [Saprolegnia parasitica CBS 223.65]|eukprot:XP_012203664.1 hypothetical protein SPRG_08930 [Saprolegnia parasitica CBS 223.65]